MCMLNFKQQPRDPFRSEYNKIRLHHSGLFLIEAFHFLIEFGPE